MKRAPESKSRAMTHAPPAQLSAAAVLPASVAHMLRHAAAPAVVLAMDGSVLLWNDRLATLTEIGAAQREHHALDEAVTADQAAASNTTERWTLIHEEAATHDAPAAWTREERIQFKTARDDVSVDMIMSFTAYMGNQKDKSTPVAVVGIGRDLSYENHVDQQRHRILDGANAPCIAVDKNGRITVFNRKAQEISEYTSAEALGVELTTQMVAENCRAHVASVIQRALQGQETASYEFTMVTKTGRRVELLINAMPRVDIKGNVVGVIGIGHDITECVVLEKEYNRLIDTAKGPIFALDKEYQIVLWNKEVASITEYPVDDAIGQDLLSFTTNKFRDKVQAVLTRAMQGDEVANFEFPLITKSGRRLDILLNASPRFDEAGQIVGVIGIGQDITDRRAQEQEYSRLIDTANAPIFGVDIEGRVNTWNKKAAQITEYSMIDVLGSKLVEEFIPLDFQRKVSDVLSKAVQGIETANFEFPLITRSGRRVEILLNATPRYDEKGEIIGVVGIGQDITVRIAQEQEYSRLIDTANAPIFGVDMCGLVNIWNKKAAEITQYAPEDVMGKDLVQQFISEEYRFAVGLVLSQALNGVQAANFNFPLITRAGRRVEILLNATPRYNELGDIVGVVGIGQDITDRIAQEQEYSRLIDTANAPIFGVDQGGLVNIWNKKAAEITQFAPSEVMGENLVEKFITEDYRDAVGCVLTKALSGAETANFEFPLMTKAGRRVEILLNATSRYNEHGQVMGMVGIGQDITDRIAQEQEYARLIEKANAPIFGVDVDGCVNIWNQKTAEITQYSRDEVIGEKLVDRFIADDYRDAVATVLAKALDGDEYSNFEVPLVTKTGRKVKILLNATTRFDQHGQIVGMVGIGQDLTDRIAQQEEYARLIDTANAPIFGVDRDLLVNIWNKKAAQITQYTTTEVMGENLVETFISPEYRPIVAEVLSKALNGIQTANFEFPLITRPGTRIEILLNATPRMDFHGNIVGVVGIGQDITDRIAQEHEYFRLIDTANAPIFGVDTFGNVNEWNQKIEEITGHHKSSVLDLSLVDSFITPESRPLVRKLLNQALIGIDVGEMELPMTTKDGRAILLLVNASSKKDMHGNIRGVIGVGQDYTAKKHMEAAKVTFLASFSHELRTPLNGVLGMLEMLREQKLEKVPQRYVHMAYVSGSLLLNLINDILDLSKIEAGHLEISKDPFQIADLLDYVVEIFKFKAKEKGIKLILNLADNVPNHVVGDVSRLRQVLLNLLSNAIKFTSEGSITVQCRAVPSPDAPKSCVKLLFQVIDTGVGMDNEEKSRLFSLFTKLDRTRKNNPTGSGLGLAICKQLVELMGGSIDVESTLNDGSEFFFTVRVDRADENYAIEQQNFSVPIPTDAALDSLPKYARILVVEDNEFNWEVVKCYFTKDNHLLQWEQNGRDAFYAYKDHHDLYDLVLMDCEMPIMDGYTATRSIRQFELENNLPRIPILGLTAYAMSGDRKKCLDAGMDEFIVKPIGKAALLAAVRQWMTVRYMSLKAANKDPSVFSDDGESLAEANTANLVPASTHNEELDLTRAISDLELEDPMMIGRENHHAGLAADSMLTMSVLSQSKSGNSLVDVINMTISEHSDSESAAELTHERLQLAILDSPMRTVDENLALNGEESNCSELSGSFSLADKGSSSISKLSMSNDQQESESGTSTPENTRIAEHANEVVAPMPILRPPPPSGPPSFTSSVLPEDIPIPDGDPIDYSRGVEQCGGDENLFFSLLEKYASVCEEYMRRIEHAFNTHDYLVLRRESHSLKGSSAYVAAMRVSKSAFRVQVASERLMATTMPHYDEIAYAASLKASFDLLKRENRLVVGYLRRNFSFRRNKANANAGESRRSDDQNACAIM